jgi:hypothetical protein
MYTKHVSPFAKITTANRPGPNGKIEEKHIVDSYTSENST